MTSPTKSRAPDTRHQWADAGQESRTSLNDEEHNR